LTGKVTIKIFWGEEDKEMCRRGISSLRGTVTVLIVLLGIAGITWGKVIYVDADAPGVKDGTNWENAYNFLKDALADANSSAKPVEIKVAQGIYRPPFYTPPPPPSGVSDYFDTASMDDFREATFQLINGVVLKGGYAGFGEPEPDARDIQLYETILSGDLNGDDEPNFVNYDENSYHVVTGSGTDETAVIDGFTITAGYTDIYITHIYGGGMLNNNGSPTVTNCTFSGNTADNSGGGMYNTLSSNPTITNCKFNGNNAYFGGGMYNYYSDPTVTNCTFNVNSAKYGGGMENTRSNPTVNSCTFNGNEAYHGGGMSNYIDSKPIVTNCTFKGNISYYYGAGMSNYDDSNSVVTNCTFSENTGSGMRNEDSNPTVTNCTFKVNTACGMVNAYSSPTVTGCTFNRNKANYGGGMMNYDDNCSPTVTNCTFSGNLADSRGGGMCSRSCNPTVTNCTFRGNSARNYGGGLYNYNDSSATVNNCILWGNTSANGPGIYNDETSSATVSYSDVEEGWEGEGNIDADPCFADPGYWDANGTPEDANDDFWIDGDYHLRSQAGRWDANSESWVQDDVTSPCIDAGNPISLIGYEPFPNGGIINMGVYGGTVEASKSYFGLPCQTIIAGDINGDCKVNFLDFGLMVLHWLEDNTPPPGQASEPSPHDGATNVAVDADLGWTAGLYATSHDVYFGTSNPPPFKANQTTTIFDPGEMDYSTVYYWRIDEVNSSWTTKGTVWSFTTLSSPPPSPP
jgi:parallel beta-helix repeat protein